MPSEVHGEHVVELLEATLARPVGERLIFLNGACAGNEALRGEIESLLDFQDQAQSFLETPAIACDLATFAGEPGGELKAGETLGDCRILSLLGEGGMGEVYLAEDLVLRRRVAIKLIRRGVGGEIIIRRFEHERRVLAGLNHPHIAQLYGGAITSDGRPYLIMEFVEGERIDEYCNRRQLPVNARLALFRKVCSAVVCAHQNLVIHRDLKPGNILVTTDGEPKLLDFGIAKLIDATTTPQPDATVTLVVAMTPAYASPEQLRGEVITTASDIYSLGVVLYELLTGLCPYRSSGHGAADLVRALEGQPTERPSTALARVAMRPENKMPACGDGPDRLRRRLRGDLDNIVLMALRREPTRRYVSVNQFSEDIRRHCDGLPVVARKDTLGYRTGKFVRRNKVGVAAAILLFLSLLLGVMATGREAARADRRFNDVRQLANSILFEVDPLMANLPGSITARTALVKRALEYLDSLAREAGNDRALNRDLATAYEKVGEVQGNPGTANIGDIKGALASYLKAQKLRQALVNTDPHGAQSRHELANNYEQTGYILWWMSQTDRALAAYNDALSLRKTLLRERPHSVDYRRGMASLQLKIGDVPAWNNDTRKALAAYDVALPLLQGIAKEQPSKVEAQVDVARCLRRMGDTRKDADDFDGALASLAQAQAIVEQVAHRDPDAYSAQTELWFVIFKRCELFLQRRDGGQAMASCPLMVSLAEQMVQRDPRDIEVLHKLANSHAYFAAAYLLMSRYEDGITEFGKALEIDADLTAKSPQTTTFKRSCANHRTGIGKAEIHLGKIDDALKNLQSARVDLESVLAADSSDLMLQRDLADVSEQVGKVYVAQHHPSEARAAFERGIAHWQTLAAASPLNKDDTGVLADLRNELAKVQ